MNTGMHVIKIGLDALPFRVFKESFNNKQLQMWTQLLITDRRKIGTGLSFKLKQGCPH
jgi:hypothetical protein